MVWSITIVLGLLNLAAAVTPLSRRWNDVAVKHSWVEVPAGWEYHSPAPIDYKFDLRVALKQDKIDTLIADLWEISDPNHARYGQHLTAAEAEALVAPHPDSREAVAAWLQHHAIAPENIIYSTGGGEWVTIRVSVAEAERMLDTKYNVYHHPSSSERVVRTLSYSLPRELHDHVSVVTPTTYFGTVRSMRATSFLQPTNNDASLDDFNDNAAVPASCANTITISCLRALYNTADYVPASTKVNKLGVAGYLDEFASYADLQTFFKMYRPEAVGSTFTVVQVNGGGNNQSNPGVEANLDIQYADGIAYPTPNIYYSTAGTPPFKPDSSSPTNTNEPYLDWLNFILNQTAIPQTISTSYGDDEQTVPLDYATTVCNLFAQLGSRGVSVLFSSGDSGVGAGDCLTNDGTDRKVFQPVFPASCPFVTAVGGTIKVAPEVGASFSGGGFSRYFSRQSYQSSAVSTFLTSLGSTYAGLFNPSGRAYPDISAQASGFQVVVNGTIQNVAGTSASAPTAAAIFSLLNDARLAAGKQPLGFLNPLLYSYPSALNDIVSGSNPRCGTSGFSARVGWDPVTGLGTPDFKRLKASLV